MSHWSTIGYWVGINVLLGVFGPLLVGYLSVWPLTPRPRLTLRQFYEKGELALVSLVTGLSVVLDMAKSHYSGHLRTASVISLSSLCLLSAIIWAVPLAFNLAKVTTVSWTKVWAASWRVALMVFSIGLVAEILVELASS